MTITTEQSIQSLRRAQELVDQGVIGQTYGTLFAVQDGKPCFCGVGAVLADLAQPEIKAHKTILYHDYVESEDEGQYVAVWGDELFMKDISAQVGPADAIIELNDDDELTFGEIADCLEKLLGKGEL